MHVLVINQEVVRRLLPMGECIEAMAEALRTLAEGDAVQPLRSAMWLPDRTRLLGVMPGYLGRPAVLGIKVITLFPGNLGTGFESHQGSVLLFDTDNGRLVAVIDAGEITAIRTAAVSAVATRCLARPEASQLAILGSGTQARTHLEAMKLVRPIRRVRVWSRDPVRARQFAEGESTRHGIAVDPVGTAQEAVADAEIICTVTGAHEPVLHGSWISPGAHINAVGACIAAARELDTDAVVRSRLYVDRRESALHEAGDILIAKAEGALDDGHIIGELGDVLTECVGGRASAQEITLFESLGLAVEDLAAAHHVYQHAVEQGEGACVEVGGQRAR